MTEFEKLIPANFRELFSFFAFFFALIFTFISLMSSKLEHGLRISAILCLVSLALFANSVSCYFASIFIIATAVTQLDFLQNLAAIIRGSKEYFDYKTGTKSPAEVKNDLETESQKIENTPVEDEIKDLEKEDISETVTKSTMSAGAFAYAVEDYVFKFLETKYHRPVQRHVRISSKKYLSEFDGILQFEERYDMIIEIKTTRRGILPLKFITESLEKLLLNVKEYKVATNRNAVLRFILIGDFTSSYKKKIISEIPNLIRSTYEVEFAFDFYSFEEIGLDINNI